MPPEPTAVPEPVEGPPPEPTSVPEPVEGPPPEPTAVPELVEGPAPDTRGNRPQRDASSHVDPRDLAAVQRQLGRPPRGVVEVAHRCPCGEPDVVVTAPVLPDGTPFPTLYYLTCPRACSAVGRLEAAGVMRAMEHRLSEDADLAADYRAAHEEYLRERATFAAPTEIEGVSAGGMPERVKCLHVLAAHSLAAGPGVNPLGDEVIDAIKPWWRPTSCADANGGDPA